MARDPRRTHTCATHEPGATITCYHDCGCRCGPCGLAASDYRQGLADGHRRNVPTDQVRPLVDRLRRAGMTLKAIAEESGLNPSTVEGIAGRRHRTVHRTTADAIRQLHDTSIPTRTVVDAAPVLAAVRRASRTRGGIAAVLDDNDRRTYYRAATRGEVDERWVDRICIDVCGTHPLLLDTTTTEAP